MIRLEPFAEEDFPRFITWAATPQLLVQWAGTASGLRHPVTTEQLQKYLQTGKADPPTRLIFRAQWEGQIVGHIELDRINREHLTASISRVFVDPAHRGRGIAAEMVRQVLEMGFTRFGVRRMDLGVYAFNAPAIRSYEKAGFVREGCLRKAILVGGEPWDLVMMAILREEWHALRK